MNYLYCPAAIRTALAAAGTDLKVLYNVKDLASIVSPEDVAFYIHCNLDSSKHLPAEIAQSLFNPLLSDKNAFPDQLSDLGKVGKEITRILNDYCNGGNAPLLNLVGQRLTCDLMDEQTILFTHIPLAAGEAADATNEGTQSLMDRLIQQLLVILPFEQVAKMPVFGLYLSASKALLA